MDAATSEYFRALVQGQQRGMLAAVLRGTLKLASFPYGLAVAVRNLGYDRGWIRSQAAQVPVVSIGNLTLGGTGKTPAVEYVARFYRGRDKRVAILSRGYGSSVGRNDEALVLEENLPDVPHLQGSNRAELAQIAVEELESEVLVLDDAFQHRRLRRDLDVVLIDATQPWGNGWLFPGGLLREPGSSLRRATVVILTRCDQVAPEQVGSLQQRIQRLAPGVLVVESRHQPMQLMNPSRAGEAGGDAETGTTAPLTELAYRPIAAFCGIGNPNAFRATLEQLGARVVDLLRFADHHAYTRADVDRLRSWAREQTPETLVVTTQKDLVKIRLAQLGGKPLWALQIALQPTAGQETLDRLLEGVLQ